MYDKPHLSYRDQLDVMRHRGLGFHDEELCLEALRRIGYYRLSGYTYPFRKIKPVEERTSGLNFRYDEFVPGHFLEESIALADFDRRLRTVILEGIDIIETGLKALMSHHGGAHSLFIHHSQADLDPERCRKSRTIDGRRTTDFEQWERRYLSLLDQAKNEDFIRHHLIKYGEPLPIWIAMEIADFGAVTRLYTLFPDRLRSEIARELGVTNGKVLEKWLKALNYLRNKCAHFSRVWNRSMTLKYPRVNHHTVQDSLHHICEIRQDAEHTDKIYYPLSTIAYMISFLEPQSRWRLKVREVVGRFPSAGTLSPENSMGFPDDWRQLPLWRSDVTLIRGTEE